MGSPDDEDFTDSESDDGFNEDMEALKIACQTVGTNPVDSNKPSPTASASAPSDDDGLDEDDSESDLDFLRGIQKRFSLDMGTLEEPLKGKPLCMLPPGLSDSDGDEDCENDYETIRAIQRRFAAYSEGGVKDNLEDILCRPWQGGAIINDSEKETSNRSVERTNAREGFLDYVDTGELRCQKSVAGVRQQPSDVFEIEWKSVRDDVSGSPVRDSQFPKSALGFVDVVKKNRSCQRFVRNKMLQVEARMEELKKVTERVKILRDFQVSCKKRIGRALSQKRDARGQLISVPKPKANSKVNEEKIRALYKGPPENVHVAKYREAMATYPVTVTRDKWSKEERENLVKGVKQQFQGMLLQHSVDHISEAAGSCQADNVDSVMALIKELDIMPEKMRLFLPKVNWEQLAAMYVPRHSGAECQAMFLNFEDPLINHNPWTSMEDKYLLYIVQEEGLSNWMNIAASMGTNRTPGQCLARYQRSLNASILKREWTDDEDNQLRAAVETYGEGNWQNVASVMEGRAGTQCSNRWIKTLHPARKRVGRWTPEEDKRLKVAVTLFGPKWKKVAGYVPGRTHPQCRERWVNSLDPSLNRSRWAKEEDLKLEAAVAEHGYCWSKVAACIPHRTDNQCWRRWKVLFPNEVPLIQAARKIRRAAFISNFVDRESEKPSLGPNDFVVPEIYRITGPENAKGSARKSRKLFENASPSRINSEEFPSLTNCSGGENTQCKSMFRKGKCKSSRSTKKDNDLTVSQKSMSCDIGKDICKTNTGSSTQKRKPRQPKKRSRCEETIVGNEKEKDASSDQRSSFPVSMLCENVMKQTEGVRGTETCKRKETRGVSFDCTVDLTGEILPTETINGNSSTSEFVGDQSSCFVGTVREKHQFSRGADRASSGYLEHFERDNELHLSENPTSVSDEKEDDMTLASFMKKVIGRNKI